MATESARLGRWPPRVIAARHRRIEAAIERDRRQARPVGERSIDR